MTLEEILVKLTEIQDAIKAQPAHNKSSITDARSQRKNFYLTSAVMFLSDVQENIELAEMTTKK